MRIITEEDTKFLLYHLINEKEMKKYFFFVRKGSKVICEHISMKKSSATNYLSMLRDVYGRKNVLISSNKNSLSVELFVNR